MTVAHLPSSDAPGPAPRPLPLWASIPIILACLTAGAGIIYLYVGSHLRADEPHLLGNVDARPAPAPPTPRGNRDRGGGWANALGTGGPRNVQPRGQSNNRDRFEAYTEHAQAWFVVADGRPPLLSVLTYGPESAYGFVPDATRQTIFAAHRLANDRRAMDELKLTPDQGRQVAQRSRLTMDASAADRALLTADFVAFRSAGGRDPGPARTKLLDDLDDVAARSQRATTKFMADNAAQLNTAVTPDQWKQYAAMGGKP